MNDYGMDSSRAFVILGHRGEDGEARSVDRVRGLRRIKDALRLLSLDNYWSRLL